MAVSKNTQALIDKAVAEALAEAGKGLVVATSKPEQISNLRATWRKSAEHGAEQLARFGRLFVVSAVPALVSLIASGSDFDKKTLLALLVPVFETVYRQVFPALGAAKADAAPGVTIVPDQVGAQTVDVPVDNTVVQVAVDDSGAGDTGGTGNTPDMTGMTDSGA